LLHSLIIINMAVTIEEAALKEQGSALFQEVLLQEAAECYTLAIACNARGEEDDKEALARRAVLFSNRSNCSFELGEYSAAAEDAAACIKILDEGEGGNVVLLCKNLWRLARSLFYLEKESRQIDEVLDKLLEKSSSSNTDTYKKQAETMKKQIEFYRTLDESKNDASSSSSSFQPILLRSALISPYTEYYPFGHDYLESALHVSSDPSKSIRLNKLTDEELSSLGVLFGGVGDGRHVLATILDAHHQYQQMDEEKKGLLKVNLTLNDTNTQVMAKNLLVLVILERLGEIAPEVGDMETNKEAWLLSLVLMYVTLGYVMPLIVFTKLQELVKLHFIDSTYEGFCQAHPALYISSVDWSKLVDVTSYWVDPTSKYPYPELFTRSPVVLQQIAVPGTGRGDLFKSFEEWDEWIENGGENYDEIMQQKRIELRARFSDYSQLPSPVLDAIRHDLGQDATEEEVVEKALEQVDRITTGVPEDDKCGVLLVDQMFYATTHALLFPLENPHFEDLNKEMKPIRDKVQGSSPSTELQRVMRPFQNKIYKTWKVNPVKFDPYWNCLTQGDFSSRDNFNAVKEWIEFFHTDDIQALLMEKQAKGVGLANASLHACVSKFYWNAAKAMRNIRDHLVLEVSLGGITDFGGLVQYDIAKRQQHGLPTRYDRILMSNIPDYTGMLSTFTQVAPLLHDNRDTIPTMMRSCILLNTGIWTDKDTYSQFVFSTVALSTKKATKFLRFDTIEDNPSAWDHFIWWGPCKDQLSVTQAEVRTWLYRLYMMIVLPPDRDISCMVKEEKASTVDLFLTVCVYCMKTLGYPVHWISGVLQELLTSSGAKPLKTKALNVNETPAKIRPETKVQKYDLSPFRVELTNQMAIWIENKRLPRCLVTNDSLLKSRVSCFCIKIPGLPSECVVSSSHFNGIASFLSLGFMLERQVNRDYRYIATIGSPGGVDQFMQRLQEGTLPKIRSKLRKALVDTGDKVGHVFSCAAWNLHKKTMTFWMCDDIFEEYKSYCFSMIRTDGWCRISHGEIQLGDAERVLS
jgi:tetratricopeptide (TPR) repeat protein